MSNPDASRQPRVIARALSGYRTETRRGAGHAARARPLPDARYGAAGRSIATAVARSAAIVTGRRTITGALSTS